MVILNSSLVVKKKLHFLFFCFIGTNALFDIMSRVSSQSSANGVASSNGDAKSSRPPPRAPSAAAAAAASGSGNVLKALRKNSQSLLNKLNALSHDDAKKSRGAKPRPLPKIRQSRVISLKENRFLFKTYFFAGFEYKKFKYKTNAIGNDKKECAFCVSSQNY